MALKEPFTAKPNNGEAQPTPFYRRRSVQAGGGALLALLTAGGLFSGLKPSHAPDSEPTLKGSAPVATGTANTPAVEATPSAAPTNAVAASEAHPLQPLCTTIPNEVVAASLGSNTSCSTTGDSQSSLVAFAPSDLAHAAWGGPEGEDDEIMVTITPSYIERQGGDQFKIAQEVNVDSNPRAITVLGYPGIYIPEEDFTVNNGAIVRTELEVIKAGPYLVSLITEQLRGSAPPQAETSQLAEDIIQHALPQS